MPRTQRPHTFRVSRYFGGSDPCRQSIDKRQLPHCPCPTAPPPASRWALGSVSTVCSILCSCSQRSRPGTLLIFTFHKQKAHHTSVRARRPDNMLAFPRMLDRKSVYPAVTQSVCHDPNRTIQMRSGCVARPVQSGTHWDWRMCVLKFTTCRYFPPTLSMITYQDQLKHMSGRMSCCPWREDMDGYNSPKKTRALSSKSSFVQESVIL